MNCLLYGEQSGLDTTFTDLQISLDSFNLVLDNILELAQLG